MTGMPAASATRQTACSAVSLTTGCCIWAQFNNNPGQIQPSLRITHFLLLLSESPLRSSSTLTNIFQALSTNSMLTPRWSAYPSSQFLMARCVSIIIYNVKMAIPAKLSILVRARVTTFQPHTRQMKRDTSCMPHRPSRAPCRVCRYENSLFLGRLQATRLAPPNRPPVMARADAISSGLISLKSGEIDMPRPSVPRVYRIILAGLFLVFLTNSPSFSQLAQMGFIREAPTYPTRVATVPVMTQARGLSLKYYTLVRPQARPMPIENWTAAHPYTLFMKRLSPQELLMVYPALTGTESILCCKIYINTYQWQFNGLIIVLCIPTLTNPLPHFPQHPKNQNIHPINLSFPLQQPTVFSSCSILLPIFLKLPVRCSSSSCSSLALFLASLYLLMASCMPFLIVSSQLWCMRACKCVCASLFLTTSRYWVSLMSYRIVWAYWVSSRSYYSMDDIRDQHPARIFVRFDIGLVFGVDDGCRILLIIADLASEYSAQDVIVRSIENYDLDLSNCHSINQARWFHNKQYFRMESKSKLPTIILVIAGPGAGKSTQCMRLAKELGYIHLSIGQILREERSAQTPQGQKLDYYMKDFQKTGRLMPCDIPLKYLMKRMRKHGLSGNTFIIDGFIKSVYMYHYWDQMIGDSVNVVGVLYLQCSDEVLMGRLTNRAKSSDREDDKNTQLAKVRLQTFKVNTMPVLALYEEQGLLWIVDAEKAMEEVYQSCKTAVEGMLGKK